MAKYQIQEHLLIRSNKLFKNNIVKFSIKFWISYDSSNYDTCIVSMNYGYFTLWKKRIFIYKACIFDFKWEPKQFAIENPINVIVFCIDSKIGCLLLRVFIDISIFKK